MAVYFGGSRNLPPLSFAPFMGVVVRRVMRSGQSVHVGCCVGADALVLASVRPSSFSQVRVFAQFAQGGGGFLAGLSNYAVLSSVPQSCISWLAGGALSVPVPVRLISRSVAALRGCSAAVFFAPGKGSLAVAARAVSAQIPVYAFTIGYFAAEPPAPIQGVAGQWVVSSFAGFACWQWQSGQLSLF